MSLPTRFGHEGMGCSSPREISGGEHFSGLGAVKIRKGMTSRERVQEAWIGLRDAVIHLSYSQRAYGVFETVTSGRLATLQRVIEESESTERRRQLLIEKSVC